MGYIYLKSVRGRNVGFIDHVFVGLLFRVADHSRGGCHEIHVATDIENTDISCPKDVDNGLPRITFA